MPGAGNEEVVMTDVATPPGLSVWEADLLRHLSQHMEQEGALLASYKTLAEKSDADYVRYLVELIMEDEIRHHRLFAELGNAIRSAVERTDGLAVPMVRNATNPEELLAATKQLLERERTDERELKRLSRELKDLRGTSVWPLLVELMERDTAKHQGILRFLEQQLEDQLKRARR
jgi:rubrerythrin